MGRASNVFLFFFRLESPKTFFLPSYRCHDSNIYILLPRVYPISTETCDFKISSSNLLYFFDSLFTNRSFFFRTVHFFEETRTVPACRINSIIPFFDRVNINGSVHGSKLITMDTSSPEQCIVVKILEETIKHSIHRLYNIRVSPEHGNKLTFKQKHSIHFFKRGDTF